IHGRRIGSSAEKIPMQTASVDCMTLHCTIDHFERDCDTFFLREAARVLKPRGKVCVLPVYFAREPENICDPRNFSPRQKFDPEARVRKVSGYGNRFGRFYSPQSFRRRILKASPHLKATLFKIAGDQPKIPNNYLHYALVMEKI